MKLLKHEVRAAHEEKRKEQLEGFNNFFNSLNPRQQKFLLEFTGYNFRTKGNQVVSEFLEDDFKINNNMSPYGETEYYILKFSSTPYGSIELPLETDSGTVLGVEWRNSAYPVGLVLLENNALLTVRIGALHPIFGGEDPDADAKYIAEHGAKLKYHEAVAFFPQLKESEYKHD